MLNLSDWISAVVKEPEDLVLKEQVRAAEAWRRIREDPDVVIFKDPKGVKLNPQIVRIESDNSASPLESTPGKAPIRRVIIYGIKGHTSLPDLDMQEKYTFIYNGDQYRCIDVITTFGEIQGIWESVG